MFHSHNIECSEFTPLQDWLILAPEKPKESIEKGIVIPGKSNAFQKCFVVAAGPDCTLRESPNWPTTFGDIVWMQKFVEGELKFHLNGVPVYAIRERRVNVALDQHTLKAVGDRILVKRLDTQAKVRGGIHIPQAAQETSQECEVVSVGAKVKTDIKRGDRVLIGKYSGTEAERDGVSLTVINENDIVGVTQPLSLQAKRPVQKSANTEKAKPVAARKRPLGVRRITAAGIDK